MKTLAYSYTKHDGEKMVYLCQVSPPPRMTTREINQFVRGRLEAEVGPVSHFVLLRQNDPEDIAMINALDND